MRWAIATAVLGLCGCAMAGRPAVSAPPLQDEGELHVYLAPFPHQSGRLTFSIRGLVAVPDGGEGIPLGVSLPGVAAAEQVRDERLLASGRLPPGRYLGLRLTVANARLAGDDGPADLLVAPEPARLDVPFEIRRGQAQVVVLSFDPERSLGDGFEFTPTFSGAAPSRISPGLVGACSSTRSNELTLFDRQTRTIGGVVATGLSPSGVALDATANRAYLALGGQDQVEVIDLSRGESVSRIHMRGGDEPRALLLLADRRTLLVVNFRSQTASFVDAVSAQQLASVPVGEAPWSVVQQRGGNRAFVVNRRSSSLTVIDLATRQAIATVPTDPEPLYAQVSRDGGRLYLIHAGSLYLTEYALPSLAVSKRIRVGLGASAVKLDPRTDLIYVAHAHEPRLEVYDPISALPVDGFDLPGWASQLAIDDEQNLLFAVMPSQRAIAVIDLTSRKVLSLIEPAGEPYEVRLAAERN